MTYAALWCKSNFSFLEGASHPDELVETAHEQGLAALAITDRDGVAGIVRAHVKAKELGMKLIVGSELTVDDGSTIVLLARDRGGYANLCGLASIGRLRSEKGTSRVTWREVCEHAPGLLALVGGERSILGGDRELLRDSRRALRDAMPREESNLDDDNARRAKRFAHRASKSFHRDDRDHHDIEGEARSLAIAADLRSAFGEHLFALAARHRRAEEVERERRLRAHAQRLDIPVAAANEVLYHRPNRRRVQDVLTCIRHGTSLSRAGRLLQANAEHDLKSRAAFEDLFRDDPLAVAWTREIASRCTFSMSDLCYRYPLEKLPDGKSASEWLHALVLEGARARYAPNAVPANVPNLIGQIEKELAVIDALDYGGYFLTMHEIVCFCRRENILCQGRGSAANSAVCYCLGITAVDPVRMGLLFERFLSMERAEPPDIDLDIEHERREEVIQHVYAKYGRTHAAMVANVIRYRAKSAVRDVGKALGFSESDLLRASELSSSWGGVEESNLVDAGFDQRSRPFQHLVEIASEIEDFPRHLSIHPGGFLLGHEPIDTLVPIENATMENRTVIQWDKDDVEALGLFKVDLLALGALTHLHKTFDLLRARGIELSMATIPADDPATYAQISKADTIGVFQIESRAQMSMLPRLRPKNYYDLVIEVSIVRPGPITGGMVHPYLRRRNGEEPVTYPHACLEPVLAKTLGVPLFQEQVMRLAVVAADYTPGEADQLRRDMAAWRKAGRIEHHREKLVTRMRAKGIAVEFAERVFEQIRGFGEYGFPESHAASFALISYAGAWLRNHHIVEFTCGLLNSLPMGFYSAATILEDAKRHGVEFRPIDVTKSSWPCTIEERAIRMGLSFVKRLRICDGESIERARAEHPFVSLADFHRRTSLNRGAIESLSEAGAFDAITRERRAALWESRGLETNERAPSATRHRRDDLQQDASSIPASSARSQASDSSNAHPEVHETRGVREPLFTDDAEPVPEFAPLLDFEEIGWDYASSQHSARGHPLAPFREQLAADHLPSAREVAALPDGERVRYAGIVICRQRPGTASGVTFMTLEDETGLVNLIVKLPVYERYSLVATTQSFLGVSGRIQAKDGVVHVLADELWKPKVRWKPTTQKSRDFR